QFWIGSDGFTDGSIHHLPFPDHFSGLGCGLWCFLIDHFTFDSQPSTTGMTQQNWGNGHFLMRRMIHWFTSLLVCHWLASYLNTLSLITLLFTHVNLDLSTELTQTKKEG